ncbi:hypothetical protein LOK49_LG02G02433 [Camellia lanceoleosa]|uniref:Uncharacterized protein n=1 Tax=Camellia lanceoleosa TaxID=1840588 RepID=A0ACC0IT29_9ERIC|nr:hypothetical protein LOK49_LG02G02433 [Camellia lanceoleosa]
MSGGQSSVRAGDGGGRTTIVAVLSERREKRNDGSEKALESDQQHWVSGVGGRFIAEVTKQVLSDLEASKFQGIPSPRVRLVRTAYKEGRRI